MSASQTHFVARHVHDLVERQHLDALDDAALLSLFLASHDESAFAALVRRHGPMVLGTCRRVLRQPEDAEDASQATFLVLARKGSSIGGRQCLAGWLHRVALRSALRLRREQARRSTETLEHEPPAQPAGDELTWREVRNVFDREVLRLPERFRLPLILCCLEGRTRVEAAKILNWSEGAVRGRLERGRKLLRSRFTRKGLALPALAFTGWLENASIGSTLPPGVPSSSLASKLADGVLRSMAIAKMQFAAWTMSAALLLGSIVGLGMYHPATAEPKPGNTPSVKTTPPAPLADAERNVDTFVLRISLAPKGEGKFDPRFSLYHVLLYVPNLRVEPPANGPDGKPTEAYARIPKEQAKKILAALNATGFFTVHAQTEPAVGRNGPHAAIKLRFQGGDDPTTQEELLPWNPRMLKSLDAIRACVDGDAAKALDQLLNQLAELRKQLKVDSIADDLLKLQGLWSAGFCPDPIRHPEETLLTKCEIDGKKITLKPRVQASPLLDLETIRGTFELSNTQERRITIKGTRDTIAKVENGTWTFEYEIEEGKLVLILPPSGTLAERIKDYWGAGRDGKVTLHRISDQISEWGKLSNGVSLRLRSPKLKYEVGQTPTFGVDVREATPGVAGKRWHWLAPQIGQFARVEVDGVWYAMPETILRMKLATKMVLHELALGQTVDRWMTAALVDDYWTAERDGKTKLVLTPGKHRIRVGYQFTPSEKGLKEANPISGVLEFEVVPRKSADAATPLTSDWGEASNGVSARIRTTKLKYDTREDPAFDLDVRDESRVAGKAWHWLAPRVTELARIEVDGTWYRMVDYDYYRKLVNRELALGQTVDSWVKIHIHHDMWTPENARTPKSLILTPGKHKLRIGYQFTSSEAGKPGAQPVSGPLEIEIVSAEATKQPT